MHPPLNGASLERLDYGVERFIPWRDKALIGWPRPSLYDGPQRLYVCIVEFYESRDGNSRHGKLTRRRFL